MIPRRLIALTMVCLFASWMTLSVSAADVDFEREILPILKGRCYSCHGPSKQKSNYRLDIRAKAVAGGESGEKAIVVGRADDSELIRRITSDDDTERMPPAPDNPKLAERDVQVLKAWINAGAVWPDSLAGNALDKTNHWAFKTPVRPALPQVGRSNWVKTPIDRFILARLEREKLEPASEADKTTLVRRLYLDLVGLPPTPEEVRAFLDDQSPNAYDRLVDRLLDSPRYGERWARLWLDAARYADSDGFEKDKQRQVWFYRDWIVNSFNRDLPYNQFLVEQLAGDLLPNPTQDQIVATGFLRNSMINEEGGVHPEQFRMEAMFDRVDAIGKSMLGLTIQCSQCHDHKYDPISQEDYYRVFAFLNNDHEANVAVYTAPEQTKRADIFRQIAEIENSLKHNHPDWKAKQAAWENQVRGYQPEWSVVRLDVDDISTGGQKYLPQDDGSFLAQGYAPTKHTAKFTAKVNQKSISAVRLELLNDPNLPLQGPGRSIYGTAALTEFRVEAASVKEPGKTQNIKIAKASSDMNPSETPLPGVYDDKSGKKRVTGPIVMAFDGKDETAWSTDIGPGRRNQPSKAVFVFEKPIENADGIILTFHVTQNHGGWNSDDNQSYNLGRFRFSITSQANAKADLLPDPVRQALSLPEDRRSSQQQAAIFSYWRTTVTEWSEANSKIEALWKEHPEGSSQLVLNHRETPRMTSILKRGDFLKPVREVKPGVPSILNQLPANAPNNRLGFALWLTDRNAPTTARSIVNRIWQAYFGTGLVVSSEDLGTQAEPPSHPELLDWLAVELMDQGWSLKSLHRLIVKSAVYRQSSSLEANAKSAQVDPYNRFLARGARIRVDGEGVRDIALAASGLLSDKLGGPSVYPPLPGFLLLPPVSYGPKVWKESTGEDRYRRGLYIFRYRSLPYPMLQAFDVPNGDASCVRRPKSNTPLQALVTLNEPVFVECAQALALKTVKEVDADNKARLKFMFQRCLSRDPSDQEIQILLGLFKRQSEKFRQPSAKPWDTAAIDPAKPPTLPKGVEPADLAAWTMVSRTLLNLDETITKE